MLLCRLKYIHMFPTDDLIDVAYEPKPLDEHFFLLSLRKQTRPDQLHKKQGLRAQTASSGPDRRPARNSGPRLKRIHHQRNLSPQSQFMLNKHNILHNITHSACDNVKMEYSMGNGKQNESRKVLTSPYTQSLYHPLLTIVSQASQRLKEDVKTERQEDGEMAIEALKDTVAAGDGLKMRNQKPRLQTRDRERLELERQKGDMEGEGAIADSGITGVQRPQHRDQGRKKKPKKSKTMMDQQVREKGQAEQEGVEIREGEGADLAITDQGK
jgi:hypothetical protein